MQERRAPGVQRAPREGGRSLLGGAERGSQAERSGARLPRISRIVIGFPGISMLFLGLL